MINLLTSGLLRTKIKLLPEKGATGLGLSESHGISRKHAVFLCAKSQFIVMLSWVGSLRRGRVVCPIVQPIQLDTMIGLMLSGLKTLHTEAIMPKSHKTNPSRKNTLTNHVSLKSIFSLLDSNKNLITSSLTMEQVKPLSEHIRGSIIKFQTMVRVEVLS